jgi:hypothetical protein
MAPPPQLPFFQKHKKWIAVLIAIFLFVALGLGLYFGLVTQKQEPASSDRQIPEKTTITPSPMPTTTLSSSPSSTPKDDEIECHENDTYFVVVGNGNHPGFLVKYKTTSDQNIECTYTVGDTDFEIGIEWAEYYLGLTGDFLLLDSGTGPPPRGLIIYDLAKRKKVFTDSYDLFYDRPSFTPLIIQDASLIYWSPKDEEVTAQNCPEKAEYESGGLGTIIEAKVELYLSTLSKQELGEYRCSPTQ